MAFYYAEGALDPVTTRKAVAEFGKPVLLLAGEYGLPPRDAAEYAGLFEHAARRTSRICQRGITESDESFVPAWKQ